MRFEIRPWRDAPWSARVPRILFVIAWAILMISLGILGRLKDASISAPLSANGPYQYPYLVQGSQLHYLSAFEMSVVNARFDAIGFYAVCAMVASFCWVFIVEYPTLKVK